MIIKPKCFYMKQYVLLRKVWSCLLLKTYRIKEINQVLSHEILVNSNRALVLSFKIIELIKNIRIDNKLNKI